MNKTLTSMLALAGVAAGSASSSDDLATYARFRARQRQQPRSAGSNRRSVYLLDQVQGKLEYGTRAKNRGPYPQHMIAQSEAFHARQAARRVSA